MKTEKIDVKLFLSILWVFVTINYIFCDVFTLMYHEELKQILAGNIGGIKITQSFLLAFAIIMEIPMVMIVLSRILKFRLNKLLNIITGILLTLIQAGSLFSDSNSYHYIFFSIVEITTTVIIIIIAFRWKDE